MTVIAADRVLLPDGLGPGWVALADGRIQAAGDGEPPRAADLVLPDGILAPGLVDIQLNGALGHDFADAEPAAWERIRAWLPSTGVTAFVPTFITAPVDELADALERFRSTAEAGDPTGDADRPLSLPLGVHLEGPFLAPARRGAHRGELMVDPTPDRIERLLAAGHGAIAYVTLAPERSGALEAVAALRAAGVLVAVGHSDATDEQVAAAADAGATMVTHLYNAQRPLHHRDPGVVGAALADPRLTVGLIADLHHVAPTALRVAFAAAGGRVALVTDATAAFGMAPGRYELGGEEVEIVGEDVPPRRPDGTLAGSSLRLDTAVANVASCGIDLEVALDAATRVPADALGRVDVGRLTAGARGDLVWLDGGPSARATWIGGRLAWARDDAAGVLPAPADGSGGAPAPR